MKKISELQRGDRVLRYMHVLEKVPPMPLFVICVTDKLVCCSLLPNVDHADPQSTTPVWEFDKFTGQEHDPEIVALMGLAAHAYKVSHIEPL